VLLQGLDHGSCRLLVVEVVGDFPTVGAALASKRLPAGFGPEEVDVAPGDAPPAVEPTLDCGAHASSIERVFEGFNSVRERQSGIKHSELNELQACTFACGLATVRGRCQR
jgi:hypothetical protein